LLAIYTKYPRTKKLEINFKRNEETKHEIIERNPKRTNTKL
jgi:hypothetical protein